MADPLVGHAEDVIGGVTSMVFTPDGRTLITGGSDSTVIIWDLTVSELTPQIGQPLTASQAVFFTDGAILATAEPDGTVVLWEVSDRARPRRVGPPLASHSDQVVFLAFSGDGRLLATGGRDNTVAVWDLAASEQPRPLGEPIRVGPTPPPDALDPESLHALALSPDGATLATGQELGVTLWDLTDPERPRPHGRPFGADAESSFSFTDALSFSPDGRMLSRGTVEVNWRSGTSPIPNDHAPSHRRSMGALTCPSFRTGRRWRPSSTVR